MAKFTSTAGSKRAKAAPTPQRSVPDIQLVPEQELHLFPKFGQWVVNAVGGKSPQTAPARFGGLIGQMSLPSARQAGVLQQLQQSYGNSYVGQVIQAKLMVGHSTDVYEQEANRVADAVMRMPEPEILPSASVSSYIQPLRIQRMYTECREEEEEKVHPKGAPEQTPTVTPALEARLNAKSGGGQPLPEGTRTFMESRFGHNFSQVRIHNDAEAAQMNRELKAQAFTRQRDIYFGSGKYKPDSREGQHLLAHELTHLVQQEEVTFTGQVSAGQVDDAFEQQAERNEEKVVRDENVCVKAIGAPPTIQRLGEEGWSPYRRGGAPGVSYSPFYTPVRTPQPNEEELVYALWLQAAPGSFAQWFLQHYHSLLAPTNNPRRVMGSLILGTGSELTFVRPDTRQLRRLREIYLSLEAFSTEDETYFSDQRNSLQVTINLWDGRYQESEENMPPGAGWFGGDINRSFESSEEYLRFQRVMARRPPEIEIPPAMARWGRF